MCDVRLVCANGMGWVDVFAHILCKNEYHTRHTRTRAVARARVFKYFKSFSYEMNFNALKNLLLNRRHGMAYAIAQMR